MEKGNRFAIIILYLFITSFFFLFFGKIEAKAERLEDSVFEGLYMTLSNGDYGGQQIWRCIPVDIGNHIYVVYDTRRNTNGFINGSGYFASSTMYYGFSGCFISETACIKKIIQWTRRKTIIGETLSNERYYCLPPEKDYGAFALSQSEWNEGKTEEDYPEYVKTGGNIFSFFSMLGYQKFECDQSNMEVFTVLVDDQGTEIECTVLFNTSEDDFTSDKWTDRQDTELQNTPDIVTLYNGTNGGVESIPELSGILNWQKGKLVYGINEDVNRVNNSDVEMMDYHDLMLPSDVKSVRVSYDNDFPEEYNYLSFYPKSPDYSNGSVQKLKVALNYHYYRNHSRMVCINGGEWFQIHRNSVSPELCLRNGLNVIFLSGYDPESLKDENYYNKAAPGPSYVYLLYWDGQEGYQATKTSDTRIEKVDCFQGAPSRTEATDNYKRISIVEDTEKDVETLGKIVMEADNPYLWINIDPVDEGVHVQVENAANAAGGFFLTLKPSDKQVDINVTSQDGTTESHYRIGIEWSKGGAFLRDLRIEEGGVMQTEYDFTINDYYCKTEESADEMVFSYIPPDAGTVKVYADREYIETASDTEEHLIHIGKGTHEVEWEVTSSKGKKVTYKAFFNRDGEEEVSAKTKRRAYNMILKMMSKGYGDYLKDMEGTDYWKTFGAASLGKEYLDGLLGFDVTKKTFNQSTDYSAVILELIMSGENPYNYLGINYVEKLLKYNDDGNFGPYSANIWALTALNAAGVEIPQKTIDAVMAQAVSRNFDLDMKGWSIYAVAPYISSMTEEQYARCVQYIKNAQVVQTTSMETIDVTGVFENSYFTNRNINSHACAVSGLVALGVDPGATEFKGRNGSDAVSVFEHYQLPSGGWFYSPLNTASGGWNKDVVIAVGDLYNGSNVYTRYYLTEEKYRLLVSQAKQMLEDDGLDPVKREALQDAYEEASRYVSDGDGINCYGEAYYALQDAMTAVDESMSPGVFLGTAEERDQVNEVKEEIERISSYSYADKKDLDQIKEKYDALGEERLYHYIRNSEVLDKAYGYVKSIDDFLETVNKIGTVNLTKTAKIKKARKAYDALSDRQKAETVVKEALKTLQDAEAAIIKMNDPDKVERAIRNLGKIVTLDMQDDIKAVREAYDSLSATDKAKVANVKDLESAEEKLRGLLAQETAIDNAASVTEKIASIGNVSRNSEDAIHQAREAYDALETEEERNLVSNYRILLDSETEYANLLDREELGNAISEADYHINQIYKAFGGSEQIGEDNYQDVTEAVEEAGQFFEQEKGKRPDFCQMISGYPSYVDIRTMLMEYSFDPDQEVTLANLEETLDSIGDTTLDREPDVRKAEMILEGLQASGEISDELETFETRIASLREEITTIRDSYPDICSLVTAIGSIGEVTQTYKDAYLEAADLYNSAEVALISLIPACTIETITGAGNKYQEIQEDLEEINRIEKMIGKARQANSLLDEELVVSARNAYEGSDRKENINNYLTLIEAERKMISLKKAVEDAQIAAEVEDMIGLLNSGSGIDPVDVALARVAYDALTDAQKKLVSNYADLELAEEKAGNIPSPSGDTDPKDDPEGSTGPAKKVAYTISLIRNKKASKPYLIGKKTKYKLVLKADGKAVAASKVKWKSGKKAIASISKNTVTFKKKGSVKITAAYGGKKYSFTIKVKKASFKLKKKKVSLKVGKKYRIRYTALPKGKATYKSMNKKIASVTKKGVVKGRRKGTVKIKIKCNGITRYQLVKVK